MTDIKSLMRQRMEELRDSNTGIQRRKQMTQEQKSREAIDYFTKEIKEYSEKTGQEKTESQARKEATELANRAERKQGR